MKLDKVVKIMSDAKSSIRSCYAAAKICHYTMRRLQDETIAIKKQMAATKIPRKHLEYLDGYVAAYHDSFEREHITDGYLFEGEMFVLDNILPEQRERWEKLIRENRENLGEHYVCIYKSNTDKVYWCGSAHPSFEVICLEKEVLDVPAIKEEGCGTIAS